MLCVISLALAVIVSGMNDELEWKASMYVCVKPLKAGVNVLLWFGRVYGGGLAYILFHAMFLF